MFDTKDTHLLFYNVFGVAVIAEDKITVQLNLYKDGRLQGRTLERELDAPLAMVSLPFMVPFGAWVQADEIYFTPGKLDGYNAEAYAANQAAIEEITKSALATIKGAVTQ